MQTRSGCSLVFVDQSAEQVAAMNCNRRVGVAVEVGDGAAWRGELERSVRPVLVVVVGVRAQDSFEVTAPPDEDAIEAVVADRAHPALSERVRVRRLHRRSDHLDAFRAEDFVEGAAELRVAVVDQQSEVASLLADLHDEVASLLRDPGAVWAGCATNSSRRLASERKKSA